MTDVQGLEITSTRTRIVLTVHKDGDTIPVPLSLDRAEAFISDMQSELSKARNP